MEWSGGLQGRVSACLCRCSPRSHPCTRPQARPHRPLVAVPFLARGSPSASVAVTQPSSFYCVSGQMWLFLTINGVMVPGLGSHLCVLRL